MFAYIFVALFALAASAAPSLDYPVNSQVPPVGRIDQPFSFTFSAQTFSSADGANYTLEDAPSWLGLDSSTRTFSGTPSASDVADYTFNLTASTSEGSATNTIVFIVSNNTGPVLYAPLSHQLNGAGSVNGEGGIVLVPNTGFSFQFANNTFTSDDSILTYYATSSDGTPLPSWLSFDSSSLTFYGTAPVVNSGISPPQYFGINLIASDYIGFTGGLAQFEIVVGPHQLELTQTTYEQNVSVGKAFNLTIPFSTIELDGIEISQSNISTITANTTGIDWIEFDDATITLSGTALQNSTSELVQIQVTDVFADVVQIAVNISVKDALFKTTIPAMNATIGEPFNFTINSTYLSSAEVTLTADISTLSASSKRKRSDVWLSFDGSTNTLSGTPSNDASNLSIELTATEGDLSSTQTFEVHAVSASTTTTTTTSAEPSASATVAATSSGHSNKKLAIGLGVALPLAFIIGALLLWLCCFKRRRTQSEKTVSPRASKSNISKPMGSDDAAPWPIAEEKMWDEPRRLSALGMFKSTSGLSGIVAEVSSESRHDGEREGSIAGVSDSSAGDEVSPLPILLSSPKSSSPITKPPPTALTINTAIANGVGHGSPVVPSAERMSGPPGFGQARKSWMPGTPAGRNWGALADYRSSAGSVMTVATDEIFRPQSPTLKLVQGSSDSHISALAPPITNITAAPTVMRQITPSVLITPPANEAVLPTWETQQSGLTVAQSGSDNTIGTYSESSGEFIEQYSGDDDEEEQYYGEPTRVSVSDHASEEDVERSWKELQYTNDNDSFEYDSAAYAQSPVRPVHQRGDSDPSNDSLPWPVGADEDDLSVEGDEFEVVKDGEERIWRRRGSDATGSNIQRESSVLDEAEFGVATRISALRPTSVWTANAETPLSPAFSVPASSRYSAVTDDSKRSSDAAARMTERAKLVEFTKKRPVSSRQSTFVGSPQKPEVDRLDSDGAPVFL
ncbi:hypothetical protein SAICODRAFT_19256 [Saitoella complicata NRRL Y-17804]|uniref:Dystroglycan-type cadherin-like domain-containing protein n=1 Tax=Saitoella complicata (strain BCRC 22490 / CBS 7301 / JCM 7358 / NBRC 10748 / NRRL Y-17804) TaxID=698492 RepID=A0A0E9NFN0_SAICN|nr:uncharacterized protein SAICODRAFT_19256 [Saitoella complicata NRRL Y-17804]ODQ52885.1 hypothetical protein SAICODRAFT_19256 [Saitoella complicata NRRL Y-17804]GAO48491.1 hypothetical protein G7K_2664-t1 [Saitoella complicata NRRL Y-17804]